LGILDSLEPTDEREEYADIVTDSRLGVICFAEKETDFATLGVG
jgi:hypothetical protein